MLGKLAGAVIGRKVAGRYSGGKGMLAGAAAPWILRRMFGPLGLAVAGGYAAKKYWDHRKSRRGGNFSD